MAGLREYELNNFNDISPEFVLKHTVSGMLPDAALKNTIKKILGSLIMTHTH